MTLQEAVEFATQLIQQHRINVGQQPDTTPVAWLGLNMSLEEAKLVLHELELKKQTLQQSLGGRQITSNLITVATGGAGAVAMLTGAALMLFPVTTLAGMITFASGAGTAGLGKVVSEQVKTMGTGDPALTVEQLERVIHDLRTAVLLVL
jgi:hypothetical protein